MMWPLAECLDPPLIVGRVKVMERIIIIVKDNVAEHLNGYKVIKGSQHGFTRGRSCLTNLLEFF